MKGNSPRCAYCGKPVIGDYTTALGKAWHPSHFICAQCRQPFDGGSFYERNGKAYCKRDFDELFGRRCASGELLGQNRYFEKDDKVYCETHYWQKFGKRCAIGGEILKGAYQINAWGDTYCAEHSAGLAECYSCHRFICERLTRGGVRYDDGHSICNRCRQTAIDTAAQGQPALMQVRRALARLGLEIGPAETPLRLVDQQELNRRSTKSYSKQPTGMACHHTLTRNGQIVERQVEAILILSGL
ncbi:MAG: LIM domain-containing protein, partial [Anaerolineae bacterium]